MSEIKSPCRLICKYNEEGVCVGCKRSRKEIVEWPEYTQEEKIGIYGKIIERGGNPYEKIRYTI
jgi:predicted Fe-S protein YdhL (DUF1289 family)